MGARRHPQCTSPESKPDWIEQPVDDGATGPQLYGRTNIISQKKLTEERRIERERLRAAEDERSAVGMPRVHEIIDSSGQRTIRGSDDLLNGTWPAMATVAPCA
jgi:hypothetical protein